MQGGKSKHAALLKCIETEKISNLHSIDRDIRVYNLSLPLQSKHYYPHFIISEDTEYPMLNHNRREYGRDCLYMYN